jgi:hypothetical protein
MPAERRWQTSARSAATASSLPSMRPISGASPVAGAAAEGLCGDAGAGGDLLELVAQDLLDGPRRGRSRGARPSRGLLAPTGTRIGLPRGDVGHQLGQMVGGVQRLSPRQGPHRPRPRGLPGRLAVTDPQHVEEFVGNNVVPADGPPEVEASQRIVAPAPASPRRPPARGGCPRRLPGATTGPILRGVRREAQPCNRSLKR